MRLKPDRLHFGDTVGIVAPASASPDPGTIDRAMAALEKLGFQPRLAVNVRKRLGFLAGTDRERAADLMRMFTNRKVKAIFCVRGGYGTARLLPLLDYAVIRKHPKILVGYSDITALHCALLTRANLVSFHGPMLNADFSSDNMPAFTLESFLRTVMQPAPAGSLCAALRAPASRRQVSGPQTAALAGGTLALPGRRVSLRGGTATGELIGGNLSVLCTTIGTRYQPSFRNKILLLEDIAEEPYRIDRMLTHLLNAGLLQQVAGVAAGINRDCVDPKAKGAKEFRQTLDDVLAERLRPLKIPVVTGLPFGHIPIQATLPIGVRATLDANLGDLIITEPAVR